MYCSQFRSDETCFCYPPIVIDDEESWLVRNSESAELRWGYSKEQMYSDQRLDATISSLEKTEVTVIFPKDIWAMILKNCTLQDLKKISLTCKQVFLVAIRLFRQTREWAIACCEVQDWSISKLCIEFQEKPLYHNQSGFVTFARMMGPKKFRELPMMIVKDLDVLAQPSWYSKKMIGFMMKGKPVAGIFDSARFLLIRYRITIDNKPDPRTRYMTIYTSHGKALYRNNLKNREFGKEAPQNLHPERVTIAESKARVKMRILRKSRRSQKPILQVVSVYL